MTAYLMIAILWVLLAGWGGFLYAVFDHEHEEYAEEVKTGRVLRQILTDERTPINGVAVPWKPTQEDAVPHVVKADTGKVKL